MPDMLKRLPKGSGRAVTKKQMQDFVKELLYEKTLDDLREIVKAKYAGMPGATAVIIQAIGKASENDDFSKLKPMLDFAFEKEQKAKTGAKK